METDYIERARQLAGQLLAEARESGDGSLTWGRGAGREREPVPDSGPFNGRCGEALLFAALSSATGDSTFEEASLRALLRVRRMLDERDGGSRLAEQMVDGLAGVGGLVYSLVRVGKWLGRPELLESAERFSQVFTPEHIARDEAFDIIWGSAGVIQGLLALEEATGSAEALRRAEQCAAHLLSHRTADPETGLRSWATLRPVPSTGFAHGSSGIAHALLRLYRRTGNVPHYEAAMEAFAFERALYLEKHRNWMESRVEPEELPLMWSWCHGAPGIALARLGALGCLRSEDDEAAVARDLRDALQATVVARMPGVDPLCCGYFGRIDILLEAGCRLGNESLVKQARRLAQERMERAREQQGFRLSPVDADVETHLHPGFWQGVAGIGYVLLRLSAPETYPSVLVMA